MERTVKKMPIKFSNKKSDGRKALTSDSNISYGQQGTSADMHKRQEKLINFENPNSVPFSVVEAYKNIRVQLTNILEKCGGKAIAISSPNASEGKSTTAINIAITLSQLNKKVVLIDTDIRRGTIHKKLKFENEAGCMDILSGRASFEQVVKHYNSYLDIITSGQIYSNTSELFDSNEFDSLLDKLNKEYDYILIDTPPVNLVSDALVISKKCDGLIYVIRSKVTTYEALRKAVSSTEKLNVNLLGVIINAVDSNNSSYKYGKGGYYNKYRYYESYSKSN